MNQKITKGIKELLEVANKETETLSVEEVINFLNDDNYLIIDVRDYKREKVKCQELSLVLEGC